MKLPFLLLVMTVCGCISFIPAGCPPPGALVYKTKAVTDPVLRVVPCADFEINGAGDQPAWKTSSWNVLTKLDSGGKNYRSRYKMMYSPGGIYLLFEGADDLITTKLYKDYENIFDGDVFEVFFHPDTTKPVYLEYEINPLEKQLVLSIARVGNQSLSWMPWNPSAPAEIRRKVKVNSTLLAKPGAAIQSWSAEVFIPYVVLGLLPDHAPKPGSRWDANFCRIDYDSGKMMLYSWSPKIQTSFHELEHYGKIEFE